ncbi:MAG: hypothetical protein GF416_06215 [Candidatus Altiarchaeales archaeon]|nr:hypothetical protein [Candidatus Altiarchaeales archaeon]MBD3416710.1 hypothetical protein [Candidatus Altiarchaeales archaeon]
MEGEKEAGVSEWVELQAARLRYLDLNMHRIASKPRNTSESYTAFDVLMNMYMRLAKLIDAAQNTSCTIRCGALCCHFPPNEITVQMDLPSISGIERLLKSSGRDFKNYIAERRFKGLPDKLMRALPRELFVFERDGVEKFYEVRATGPEISSEKFYNLPLRWDGTRLWITRRSVACAFLDGDRCSLYLKGIRPICCSDFMCSMAVSLQLTKYLGYLDESQLSGMSLPELKRVSDRLFLLYGSEELKDLEMELHSKSIAFVDSYLRGDLDGRIEDFNRSYGEYLSCRRKLFEEALNPDFLASLRRLFS